MTKFKKILIMGLPGSGKTTLAKNLNSKIKSKWLNADKVRKDFNNYLERVADMSQDNVKKFVNIIRTKLALRTRFQNIIGYKYDGCHPSVLKSGYDDYQILKELVIESNCSINELVMSRRTYS